MTHSYSRAMPQQVPLAVYQQVVSDLEAAHMRLAQMSGECDQLRQQYHQLQTEIQVISQRLQALTPKAPVSAPAPQSPPQAEPAPDFEFLNHLKRRQQGTASSSPPQQPPRSPAPSTDPRFEPRSEHPEMGRQPDPRSGRSRYGSRYERYEAAAPNLDPLEHLFTDPGIPYDTESSAYRRAHHGGSPLSWVWIGVAVVLVIGSFGAGFLVVQPFVRGDKTESPTLPTPKVP